MSADLGRRSVVVAVAALLVALGVGTAPAGAHVDGTDDYRWLGDDEAPLGRTATLTPGVPADVWTPDAQAVLSLPADALDGAPDAGRPVGIEPVPVDDLPALPEDLAPAGNAYRVTIDLAGAGAISLAGGHPVTAVLHSSDGRAWTVLDHVPAGDGRVQAPLSAGGWYLAATDDGHGRPPLGASVAAAAVGAVLMGAGLRRRRSATSA